MSHVIHITSHLTRHVSHIVNLSYCLYQLASLNLTSNHHQCFSYNPQILSLSLTPLYLLHIFMPIILTDIDECRESSSLCGLTNSTCINKPGSYTCECENSEMQCEGECDDVVFILQPASDTESIFFFIAVTEPTVECPGLLCSQHASCKYNSTLNHFHCQCDDGFKGDGVVCSGIQCSLLFTKLYCSE